MRRRRDATGRAPPHDLCAGSAAHGSPQSRRRGRSPPRHRSGTTTLMRSAVSTMAGKRSAQSWPLRVKQRTRGAGRSGVTLPYPVCWASISIWSKSSPWLLLRSRSLRYESPDHFLSLPKRTSDRVFIISGTCESGHIMLHPSLLPASAMGRCSASHPKLFSQPKMCTISPRRVDWPNRSAACDGYVP